MEFAMMGISYKTAALSIREQCAFSDTECLSFYNTLLEYGVMQAVIVSTCNRSELYFLYESQEQYKAAKTAYINATSKQVIPCLHERHGRCAMLHLFEVCCGYHSQVPGEDQIISQMKKAYDLSCAGGACGKELHKIFQSCFASARRIKAKWQINQNAVSIAYLSMQKLKQHVDFKDKTILIIGSGEMAERLRTYALEEPFKNILLCNRTMEHLDKSAACQIIPFDERYDAIKRSDIICTATASPHVIIQREKLCAIDHRIYMVDLAVPRDVDPDLKHHEWITLWDMDDMQNCVDENIIERKARLDTAHETMQKDAEETYAWLVHHACDHVIASLQQRSEDMAFMTYELLINKLSLSAHEQYVLKKVLHTSFLRMVKEPVLQLKKLEVEDRDAYIHMLETLFKGDGSL